AARQLHGGLVLPGLALAALDRIRAAAALGDERHAHHLRRAARIREQAFVGEVEILALALEPQRRAALRLDHSGGVGARYGRWRLRRLAPLHRRADEDCEGNGDRGQDEPRQTPPLHGWAARMSARVSST